MTDHVDVKALYTNRVEAYTSFNSLFRAAEAYRAFFSSYERLRPNLRIDLQIPGVRLREANVLDLGDLPDDWTQYDLIVSAAMLEYVPREVIAHAPHLVAAVALSQRRGPRL